MTLAYQYAAEIYGRHNDAIPNHAGARNFQPLPCGAVLQQRAGKRAHHSQKVDANLTPTSRSQSVLPALVPRKLQGSEHSNRPSTAMLPTLQHGKAKGKRPSLKDYPESKSSNSLLLANSSPDSNSLNEEVQEIDAYFSKSDQVLSQPQKSQIHKIPSCGKQALLNVDDLEIQDNSEGELRFVIQDAVPQLLNNSSRNMLSPAKVASSDKTDPQYLNRPNANLMSPVGNKISGRKPLELNHKKISLSTLAKAVCALISCQRRAWLRQSERPGVSDAFEQMRTHGGRYRMRDLPMYPLTSFADQDARNEISAVAPGLWLSNWRGAERAAELQALGVGHVLCVLPALESGENPFPDRFAYMNLEVQDTDDDRGALRAQLSRAVAFIREATGAAAASGRGGCLVHCAAGVSRSGAVVVAYLMGEYRLTLREALAAVRQRRPIVWPNEGFVAELAELEAAAHRGLRTLTAGDYGAWHSDGPAGAAAAGGAAGSAATPRPAEAAAPVPNSESPVGWAGCAGADSPKLLGMAPQRRGDWHQKPLRRMGTSKRVSIFSLDEPIAAAAAAAAAVAAASAAAAAGADSPAVRRPAKAAAGPSPGSREGIARGRRRRAADPGLPCAAI